MTAKILVPVGPNSLNPETLGQCAAAGVYVFRINLSHTPLDKVAECIEKIQKWSDVPVCLDSEGAQLRNRSMANGAAHFVEGERVDVHFGSVVGDAANISFSPRGAAEEFEIGDTIRVDFNGAQLEIAEKHADRCVATVIRGGRVGSNKAADIDRAIKLDAFTEKDEAAIKIGREMGVTHFALSFASTPEDVRRMRELCGPDATIISKIETRLALENLAAIFNETDEILIDRGDLSRELPIEKIPFLQRRIVSMAKAHGIPV
jgi:pyruvate kinase